jgi:hypothetical protein
MEQGDREIDPDSKPSEGCGKGCYMLTKKVPIKDWHRVRHPHLLLGVCGVGEGERIEFSEQGKRNLFKSLLWR